LSKSYENRQENIFWSYTKTCRPMTTLKGQSWRLYTTS